MHLLHIFSKSFFDNILNKKQCTIDYYSFSLLLGMCVQMCVCMFVGVLMCMGMGEHINDYDIRK